MVRPLIHIGYHKTGTTWLQRCLFCRADLGFVPLDEHRDIHQQIVFPHPLDYDPQRCRQYFQVRFEPIASQGKLPVLSAERLCGNPHSGGYDSKEIADRLAATFPEARILIVLREQKSIILSTYKQYVRAGGSASIRQYLCPPERGRSRVPMFDFDHFKYDRLLSHYQRLFGKENVLAMPYEWFSNEPRDYVARIVSFAGLQVPDALLNDLPFQKKENEGLSGLAVALKRRLNPVVQEDRLNPVPWFPLTKAERLLRRTVGAVDRIVPRRIAQALEARLRAVVCEQVGDRYKHSNARTGELIGMALDRFGYDLP